MLSGHLYFVQNFGDDFIGGDVVGFSLVGKADAVAEYIVAHCAHILGNHIAALVKECIGAGGTCKRDGRTWRCSESDDAGEIVQAIFGGETGGENDVDDVTFNLSIISSGLRSGRTSFFSFEMF